MTVALQPEAMGVVLQVLIGLALVTVLAFSVTSRQVKLSAHRLLGVEEKQEGRWDRAKRGLDDDLKRCGMTMAAGEFVTIWLALVVAAPIAAFLLGAPAVGAALAAGVAAIGPMLWLRIQKSKSSRRFERLLGDTLPLIASNLRGGLSLRQALTPVAKNMGEPIASEFARLTADIDTGTPIDEAMRVMGLRNNCSDMILLSEAVAAQKVSGGNLADIVDTVGEVVRERTRMREDIRSKTSSARMSAKVLLGLPPILGCAIVAMNEMYREFFTSPTGILVIVLAAIFDLIGYMVIKKMADIHID